MILRYVYYIILIIFLFRKLLQIYIAFQICKTVKYPTKTYNNNIKSNSKNIDQEKEIFDFTKKLSGCSIDTKQYTLKIQEPLIPTNIRFDSIACIMYLSMANNIQLYGLF